MARNDIHRVGSFVSSEYRVVLAYSKSEGFAYGVSCKDGNHSESGRCCLVALLNNAPFFNGAQTSKCTICGARFQTGVVMRHEPTGEHIHVGHECADKYAEVDHLTRNELSKIKELLKERGRAARVAAYLEREGLTHVFAHDHHVVIKDMRERLLQTEFLSEKQVSYACSLYSQAMAPVRQEQELEKMTTAPQGRMTFRGTVVSVKSYDNHYGSVTKVTVKVTNDNGVWLAWGTCPSSVYSTTAVVGKAIEITATLKPGREPHFAVMSRPIGRMLEE